MGLFLFLLIDAATPPLLCLYSVSGFRGVMLGGVWAVLFFSFAIAFSLFLLVKIKFYSK
jgi:hypothetical protein